MNNIATFADNTVINITGQQLLDMGYNIGDDKPSMKFILHIDLQNQEIRIHPDVDGADFDPSYNFDYTETLQDLNDEDMLPRGLPGGNSLYYNDLEKETSECIQHAAVGHICDMSDLEVKALQSIKQLNSLITTFSITTEPVFELIEQ